MLPEKYLKPYDPKNTETKIYASWENSGYFNPDNLPRDKYPENSDRFSIIMPPPNANGSLHAGHALCITLEDVITRYKRMRGFKTLWVPGADHAGFETQIVYEKKLEKEGRTRMKIDPKELYREILDFTLQNKKSMEDEVKRLGASCDWSREKFTLDGDVTKEVGKTFKKMFDDGLIYRGKRMVNWCTKHQTSLSDVETESKEMIDKLYYIKYGPFTVATVRPETIFGDVAIAVNPNDARYKKYIGDVVEVETPIGKMNLKVIADEAVDMEFGTGALKITPAHDKNDFEIASKHDLPSIEVINQYGRLNHKTGKYAEMKIDEARKEVVNDLTSMGLISKIEDYKHEVPACYKCNSTIEPRIMPQWFVKMKPLTELATKTVEEDKIKFIPENYRKIFLYWMNNSIDWNISRQIIWGIPIPAKICDQCEIGIPDLEDNILWCRNCGGPLRRDSDTFDTWFSSGQWPLLSLGYPENKDFKEFYPTTVMETGRDLIFKWIPRMVIFGLYLAKERPFKYVYLNGLINDASGKKMSKSKGNVINPNDMREKFGTDALRIGLIIGNTPGSDMSLSDNKIKSYKNFANKVWNITRFILSSTETIDLGEKVDLTEEYQEIWNTHKDTVSDITSDMENFRFHLASEKIYHYIWHTFADIIIEKSKPFLNSEDLLAKKSANFVLRSIWIDSLKILHPFMPFLTEEIWQDLNTKDKEKDLLIIERWPDYEDKK